MKSQDDQPRLAWQSVLDLTVTTSEQICDQDLSGLGPKYAIGEDDMTVSCDANDNANMSFDFGTTETRENEAYEFFCDFIEIDLLQQDLQTNLDEVERKRSIR